ncbi:Oidioi.mRNA.OKI2018_I69.XSR.g15432.t1.cds [Oikopleura dioica]|uniref:Oidioi.mRNA.OKI2018_I69.XSR.g15432.t1.cds n=1 Tax=Oikopleura dioica TaxID=34765 RepID=A0ABN7SDE5_OIKDI|nr:Oidioi.mRNA.OKI2018_I69.XSR.g15432.t1.cds [Oikopleura dioica]
MSSSTDTYGTTFVVVGSKTTVTPPVRNLPKRTPSRLDNARRWAPTSYSKNHAEQHRRVQTGQFSNSENSQNEKKLATLRLEEKVEEPLTVPERALPPPPRSSSGSPAPPPPPADYNHSSVAKSSTSAEPFYI